MTTPEIATLMQKVDGMDKSTLGYASSKHTLDSAIAFSAQTQNKTITEVTQEAKALLIPKSTTT